MTGTCSNKKRSKVLNFRVESYDQCAEEIQEMCETWWKESKFYKDWGVGFEVDMGMFKAQEESMIVLAGS
jgi:hypothetical protein